MITVDCRDVEPIKNELLIYVADNIGAIPTIKLHEFDLSPIDDDDEIDKTQVITAIKEFLNSIGESANFAVMPKGNVIFLKSLTGKKIERDTPPPTAQMFSCTHCGFVTRYEVEYNKHVKIHYL